MKKMLLIIFTITSTIVMADENCSDTQTLNSATEQMEIKTDVPKFLEGATICVKLADGKESCVPAEKFKVVARKQQFVVTKETTSTLRVCSANQKNRISVLAGKAATGGLDRSRSGNTESVSTEYDTALGLQYQRQLNLKVLDLPLSIGGQLQNNGSALGTIGVDF